ncbi:Glutamate receptor U1 [Portunus trituberculatus]|uniref:Glutamate receptor U1 n=1 Tax=Portunus trituberculatus TaxID=210409 RepID=A0A5B7FGJ0_PORTR|nr:Glutamate receptor U1 [Portunus trituberculatus]
MARPLPEVLGSPEVVNSLTQNPAIFRFPDGALATVAAVHWRPHIVVTPDSEGKLVVSGPMGNVLSVLAETLNFTYNVVSPADRAWGAEQPDGNWTGMVGQVSRKEVDLALGPFGITYNRTKFVDFTESLFFDARGILSRKGTPEIDPWGFLYPLTGSVWAAVAAALAVVWLVMMMVGRRPGGVVSVSWAAEVFLQNVRVFFNQGLTGVVLGYGGVVMLSSWVVVAAVVFWSYTGTLTSLLAVRHIPQPIQTLRDLLDDSAVSVIMLPMTIVTDTISRMKSGELRELHELKFVGRVRYERTSAFREMLETVVRHEGYSILDTSLTLDLLIAGDFLKTSIIMNMLYVWVRSMVESGLYMHWLTNAIPAVTTCRFSPSIILVQEPLSLANLWVSLLAHSIVCLCNV